MKTHRTPGCHGGKGVLIGLMVMAVVAAVLLWPRFSPGLTREALVDYGRQVPAGWFLLAMWILPLLGFPVSAFLLVAGVRFGLAGGMAVAAVAMVAHHLSAYVLARGRLRDWLQRRLVRWGYGIPMIPRRHRMWLTAVVAAVHGPPYAAKLYFMAMANVPLGIYLGVGAPVYWLFCLIPVAAGSAVHGIEPLWIYGLLAGSALLVAISYGLRRRLGWGGMQDARRGQSPGAK